MTVDVTLTRDAKQQEPRKPSCCSDSLWRSLDPSFDKVVIDICRRLLPDGYITSDDAPNTFEALIKSSKMGVPLKVWSGASDYTIYGSPEVNYAFRAWHDYCHIQGRFPFTLAGEAAACAMQMEHIEKFYGNTQQTMRWRMYVLAEVLGQAMFAYVQDNFPLNQRRFVRRFADLLLEKEAELPKRMLA